MPDMIATLLFIFAGVLALSVGATRAAISLARWRKIIDHPNQRSSHTRPTPRGGGVGIVVAMALGTFECVLLDLVPVRFAVALGGGLPIAVIGYVDDRISLSARVRLAVQAASAACGLWALAPLPGLEMGGVALGPAISFAFYFFSIVWLTNLFN